jgi:hypothetical protein
MLAKETYKQQSQHIKGGNINAKDLINKITATKK